MAVDFHAHLAREQRGFMPPFMRALFDVDGYLERQAQSGIELTVLSHALSDVAGTAAELEEARKEHDFLAELVARHPDRLVALAALNPFGGPEWLAEAERALDAGFAGLCFPTSVGGRYLDADQAADAFALAAERGVTVLLHPSEIPVGLDRMGDAILGAWIGLPFDTGICVSRLLLADTLGKHPDLQIVVAHSGGALPMLLGRLDHVYSSFQRRAVFAGFGGGGGMGPPGMGPPGATGPPSAADTAVKPLLEDPPPSQRIGQIHLDTASYHPAAIRAAIEAVGVERVVLGTDHPPAGDSPVATLELVRALGLTEAEQDQILAGNARRLLGRPS